MQRKKVLYLVAILAILLAAVPLSASAQPAAPNSGAAETVGNEALPTALDAKLASDGPAAPAAPAVNPAAILYDNGPLVTNAGGGAGGADASAVQTAVLQSTYGFGHQVVNGNRVADDFTVPAGGWNISTITFYAYQTGSTTTTTINDVRLQIWDGVPGVGNVVFGDTTTNRLAGSSWSNIYRVLDTGLTDSTRPIMADVVTVNTTLPAGTYWLDWMTGGTLASGPWAPPVTLPGQTAKPGANGMQSLAGAAFAPAIDTGSGAVQDFPFVIEGAGAVGPSISLAKTVGTTPGVCAATSNITVPEGTTVYYCYTVTNTGDTTLDLHDLSDDQLGTIFTGLAYALTPGSSVNTVQAGLSISAVMNTTTTNVGNWTAYNVAGAQATATATAVVNVTPNRCPAGSNEVSLLTEGFEGSFPPAGWTVANTTTGCNPPGVPDWTNTDPGANTNLTGGSGLFATADSDACGSSSVMNAQMWSAPLDFTGLTNPMVSYYTDYNDLSTGSATEIADLDYSTDGGATWSNILSWDEDHRGPLMVEQPFAADGEANSLVRWNYQNATWDWWWQVDSVEVTACEAAGGQCPAGPEVGELTPNDPTFNRPVGFGGSCTPSGVGTAVYYDVYSYDLQGSVPQDLFASLVGGTTMDTVLVFYQAPDGSQNPFDPTQPCLNSVAYNDDFSGLQSQISATDLGTGWVDVVVTTFSNDTTGPYTMDVSSQSCGGGGGTPNIYVDPLSMASTQATNTQVQQTLTISNTGGGTLNWTIDEENLPGPDLILPTQSSIYDGSANEAAKAAGAQATQQVTIGDNALTAAGTGVGQSVTPERPATPDGLVTITHSLSQSIIALNSVSCNAGGLHTDNSYMRVFDLAAFGLANGLDVTEVEFGIEQALGATGSQPVTVNLYVKTVPANPLTFANLTLIGTANTSVSDQSATVLAVPVAGSAGAGSILVVEVFTPNGQAAGNSFFIGSNNLGQTAPSYLAAADCGVLEPTDTAAIGFPGMHIVMNVTGDVDVMPPTACTALADIPWLSLDAINGSNGGGTATDVTVTFDSTGYGAGTYTGNLCVGSDDPDPGPGNETDLVIVPMTMTVETVQNDPNIYVDPLSMDSTQATNTQVQETLTISNTGGGTLNWTIDEEPTVLPTAIGAAPRAPQTADTGSRGGSAGGSPPMVYDSPADFSEDFADITLLPGQGWFFQNNSQPLGTTDWFQGNDTVFPSHAGAPTAYIGTNYQNTGDLGTISNWMLTPELALSNGDTISFWTRTPDGSIWPDRLEMRLSTAGASTNVGALATDVGDFTTLLLSVNPTLQQFVYPEVWTQYSATLSGIPGGATGRIAWRYFVTGAGALGDNSNYIGVDTVEFTNASGGTCSAPSDIPWLSLDTTAGANAGGTDTDVTVTFDSTGYGAGTYTGNLCVDSNDPDAGPGNETDLVIVPVTMTVEADEPPFYCNMPNENFESGVPPTGWTVVNNVPGGASWGDIAACDPSGNGGNWTGGSGNAACMSPGTLEPTHAYDAELRSPMFSLVGQSSASVGYLANYQNWSGIDRLNLDISADGGATWTNLLLWNGDYGAFQNLPGVSAWADLTPFVGQGNLMLRWHYFWNAPTAIGWYAQVDNVGIDCTELPPTAVTLNSVSANPAAPLAGLPLATLPAAAAAALGAAFVWRRKRD